MDRRKALKNIGISLGYTVAAPTLISIAQSCKHENTIDWTPSFFANEQAMVITHLVDIILPKTDTPAATEVQVDIFIDKFANEVLEKEHQDMVKIGFGKFVSKALETSGKEKPIDLKPEDLEPVLANTLKIAKEQEEKYQQVIEAYLDENNDYKTLNDETARYAFANSLRGMAILGYKSSEYIGEEVLAYLPIPGEYIACNDVEKLTGGKAWSL